MITPNIQSKTYKLPNYSLKSDALTNFSQIDCNLWHLRFGHTSHKKLIPFSPNSLLIRRNAHGFSAILVYIDDLLIAENYMAEINNIKHLLDL